MKFEPKSQTFEKWWPNLNKHPTWKVRPCRVWTHISSSTSYPALIDLWGLSCNMSCEGPRRRTQQQTLNMRGLSPAFLDIYNHCLHGSLWQHQCSAGLPWPLTTTLPLDRWTGLLCSPECFRASNYTPTPHQTPAQHASPSLEGGSELVRWNRGARVCNLAVRRMWTESGSPSHNLYSMVPALGCPAWATGSHQSWAEVC